MIEVPRAALIAQKMAEYAEFFSFGTNDLTQLTYGYSRDDVAKFLPRYLDMGLVPADPFSILDQDGVGRADRPRDRPGPPPPPRPQGRDLRRARGRGVVGRVLPQGRDELRVLLAVPHPGRAPGRRPGADQGATGRRRRPSLADRGPRPFGAPPAVTRRARAGGTPMSVRFGLSVPNRGVVIGAGNPKDLVAMCEAADASELFDAVFTGDNLISKPRIDAIVFLSLVAGRTRRVTLGTACLASFVFRHPIVLANQWAALDLLSDGRTLLVACIGGGPDTRRGPPSPSGAKWETEFAAMGVPVAERVGRMVEGMGILRALWTGEAVTHHGRFYRFDDVRIHVTPVQQPCPIAIASNPQAAERGRGDDRARPPARGGDRRRLAGGDELARGVRRPVGADPRSRTGRRPRSPAGHVDDPLLRERPGPEPGRLRRGAALLRGLPPRNVPRGLPPVAPRHGHAGRGDRAPRRLPRRRLHAPDPPVRELGPDRPDAAGDGDGPCRPSGTTRRG